MIGKRLPRVARSPRTGRGPLRPIVRSRPYSGGRGIRHRGLLREGLIFGGALAAAVGCLMFLLGLRPAAPHGPRPHISIPKGAPPHVPAPAVGGPQVGTPHVRQPSSPRGSAGASSAGSAPSAHASGIEHRNEILHHHHLRFIFMWEGEWGLVAGMALLAGYITRRDGADRARGWPKRTGPAVLKAIVLALAACLLLLNSIVVPDQSFGPEHVHFVRQATKTLGDGTKVITAHWHVHHIHLPIRIYVIPLLLGIGSGWSATRRAQTVRAARASGSGTGSGEDARTSSARTN